MKAESLVTAGQHTAVNTFPGLVHTSSPPRSALRFGGGSHRRTVKPSASFHYPVVKGQPQPRKRASARSGRDGVMPPQAGAPFPNQGLGGRLRSEGGLAQAVRAR